MGEEEISRELYEYWNDKGHEKAVRLLDPEGRQKLVTKTLDAIYGREQGKTIEHSEYKNTTFLWWLTRAAGIVLIAFFLGLTVYILSGQRNYGTDGTATILEKYNPRGLKSRIFLEDGSTIILNAESTLVFPSEFGPGERRVKLLGEAYFDIVEDIDRPFIVETGDLTVVARGTAFNIRKYGDMGETYVALVDGNIEIDDATGRGFFQPLSLKSGEGLAFNRQTGEVKRNYFNLKEQTAWKDGILYFNEEDFSSVIARLERWYGVSIEPGNLVDEDWNFSGEYNHEYLINVLLGLSYSKDFTFEISGKHVSITAVH
jgi:ferric-dicitrate binding protein FerR (iron transport regulator)